MGLSVLVLVVGLVFVVYSVDFVLVLVVCCT